MSKRQCTRRALALAAAVWCAPAPAVCEDASGTTTTTNETTTAVAAETPWYQGATLQKATCEQWTQASVQNQLATAAAFSLESPRVKSEFQRSGEKMDSVLPYANKMRHCINAALRGNSKLYASVPAADVAITCRIMLQM